MIAVPEVPSGPSVLVKLLAVLVFLVAFALVPLATGPWRRHPWVACFAAASVGWASATVWAYYHPVEGSEDWTVIVLVGFAPAFIVGWGLLARGLLAAIYAIRSLRDDPSTKTVP